MNMKKIMTQMNLLMGVTLSFCLSLVGNLRAEKFSVVGFLISFVISVIISMIIGFCVPVKPLTDKLEAKCGIRPRSTGAKFFDALISDLIYTPIITIVMTIFAYKQATSHGAEIPFVPMLISSLLISLVVGYILIFICMPLFLKLVFKWNNIDPAAGGPPAGGPPVGGPPPAE